MDVSFGTAVASAVCKQLSIGSTVVCTDKVVALVNQAGKVAYYCKTLVSKSTGNQLFILY